VDASSLSQQIKKLEGRLDKMKEYLQLKYDEEDWHGVADAAMDIREIVAEIKCLKKITSQGL
jgi:hypothetical protein